MQILDMGETAIDEETFREYLTEMRLHYTADKVRIFVYCFSQRIYAIIFSTTF